MKNENYQFIGIHESIKYSDGVYNGRYNGEAALIRIKGGIPVFVTFMGFIKCDESGNEIPNCSNIYKPEGIILSNVELLLQEGLIIKKLNEI